MRYVEEAVGEPGDHRTLAKHGVDFIDFASEHVELSDRFLTETLILKTASFYAYRSAAFDFCGIRDAVADSRKVASDDLSWSAFRQ